MCIGRMLKWGESDPEGNRSAWVRGREGGRMERVWKEKKGYWASSSGLHYDRIIGRVVKGFDG